MKKFMLIILDGFGIREETEGNAFANAKTPNLNNMFNDCPMSMIETSDNRSLLGRQLGSAWSQDHRRTRMGGSNLIEARQKRSTWR